MRSAAAMTSCAPPSPCAATIRCRLVAPPHATELAVIDLAAHAESDRAAEAMRLATEEASQPFDLETGPLFRAKLVRLGPRGGRAPADHAPHRFRRLVDRRLVPGAQATLRGVPRRPDLAARRVAAAIRRLRGLATAPVEEGRLDREAAYWTRQLDQLPPACTFPADRPRPAIQSYRGAIEQVFIDRQLIDRLKSFAARENVTLFMTLLAAFKTLLFRYNGQDDCVVGVPIASRPQKELESLIGFFANTLVLRSSLAGDPSFIELLARVRADGAWRLCASGHSARTDHGKFDGSRAISAARRCSRSCSPFRTCRRRSGCGGDDRSLRAGLPSISLPVSPRGPSGSTTRRRNSISRSYLSEVDEGMSVTWQFNTDLFEPATIHRLAWQFQTLLEGIADRSAARSCRSCRFCLKPTAARLEIDWNRTETRQLLGRNFVQLFEAQVERTPNAVAVLGEDSRVHLSRAQ